MIISSIFSLALTATTPTPAKLAIETCQLGDVYAFSSANCEITLSNSGEKPIRVDAIDAVRIGEGKVLPSTSVVPPHGKAYVRATVNVGNALGSSRFLFRFRTDEHGHENHTAQALGFVLSALDQPKMEVNFGVVKLGATQPEKKAVLGSHETASFRIENIIEKPSWLNVNIDAGRTTLELRVLPNAGWGLHADFIKLAVDTPRQKEFWLAVKSDIQSDVVPDSNPVDLGLMRFGNRNEHLVRVTSRTETDFEIGKVQLDGIKGTAVPLPCQPKAKGCRLVRLSVSDQQPSGVINGKILLSLSGSDQVLPISVWGLIVPEDMKVQTLNGDKLAAEEKRNKNSSSAVSPGVITNSVDISDALKQISSSNGSAMELAPVGAGPLLKWTVADGAAIYGFQIFRSDSEPGPFVLVNPTLVHAATHGNEAVRYQWRDNSAQSDKTYWYYVGFIYNNGAKQQLTQPRKVLAK